MDFCKFHGTMVVKTFFRLEINILRTNLGDVRVILIKIMAAAPV